VSDVSLTLAGKGAALLVPLALLVAYLAYRRTAPAVRGTTRLLLSGLRGLGLLLLLSALCEPVAVVTSEERGRPVVALLLDGSRSMEIADVPAAGGARATRRRAALALLGAGGDGGRPGGIATRRPGGLEAELASRHDVVPLVFGEEAVAGVPWGGDIGSLAETTDLAAALGGARQTGEVDAVVLVTDGARTAGGDPIAAARAFGRPIFAIGVGDTTQAKDLAVTGVLASEVVYAGVPSPIVATLRGRGLLGRRVEARVEEGPALLARDSVDFPEGSEIAEVRFLPALAADGVHRLTVRLTPIAGEATVENNAQSFAMKVLPKRIEVLLLFGHPEHDLAFLGRALGAEEGLRVDAWFLDASGRLRKGAGERPPPAAGLTEETLFRYDLVLIGSPTAALFLRAAGPLLAAYLERREGALIVLPGEQGYRTLPRELWPLLPASPPPERGAALIAGPIGTALSLEGEGHPLVRLSPDAEPNRSLWRTLPPLSGAAALGAPRADALVLAVGRAGHADDGARPARGGDIPLLVVSRHPGGRVLLVAGRGLWRWEFQTWGAGRSGEAPTRLWGNAVRWLVSRGEFQRVEVRPEAPSFRRGERVRFFARVLDESFRPIDDAAVRVTLSRDGDSTFAADVALGAAGAPGEYRGAAAGLVPGLYRFRGVATRQGLALGGDEGEVVVSERSPEFEETTMDEPTLRAMADVSGGRYVSLADYRPGALELELAERSRSVRREIPLWNHPLLYLCVVGVFVSEWWLRKRRDLP
jgi:hypothetical protein